MCFDEIVAQEKEQTERIRNWHPPDERLIDLILDFERFTRIIEGKESLGFEVGEAENVSLLILHERLSKLTGQQRGEFAAEPQMPPPIFRANQHDRDALDVLVEFFRRDVIERKIGDSADGRLDTLDQGEKARIELAARRQFRR